MAGSGEPVVYLLRIDGLITAQNTVRSLVTGETTPSTVEQVRFQLDRLERDRVRPVGLLVRVNSPGGTVTASDIIHHELRAFKRRHDVPVVTLLMDVATSGAYYVAAASDRIVAHPTTTTGSLGVIMPSFNIAGLMDKLGVEDRSVTSVPFKDLQAPTKPPSAEDRRIVQSVVDGLHARFLTIIRQGRGDRLQGPVEEIADGRIYTAPQARDRGLVDRIGYFDDALDTLRRLSGVDRFRVVTLDKRSEESAPNPYMARDAGAAPGARLGHLLAPAADPAPFQYLWQPWR